MTAPDEPQTVTHCIVAQVTLRVMVTAELPITDSAVKVVTAIEHAINGALVSGSHQVENVKIESYRRGT